MYTTIKFILVNLYQFSYVGKILLYYIKVLTISISHVLVYEQITITKMCAYNNKKKWIILFILNYN